MLLEHGGAPEEWCCWYCGLVGALRLLDGDPALRVCRACGAPLFFGAIVVFPAPRELQTPEGRATLHGRPSKSPRPRSSEP